MIKIIYVPNRFEPRKNRTITEEVWQGKTLKQFLPKNGNYNVSLNQKLTKDYDIIVPDYSEIIITPKQEISAISGAIYSLFVSGGAALYASSSLLAGTMTAGMMLATVAGAAVVIAGSMLLNSVLAPQMPNYQAQSISESPTYSWNTAQTLPRAGSVIPVLYGRHVVAGNIIQRRIEYVGNDEYLYLLLALCMGTIKHIEKDDVKINNIPLTEYTDVEFFPTNGFANQNALPYFGDIETANNFSTEIEQTSVTRTTIGNAVEALRLYIQFPNGLYYSNDSGGLDSKSVEFKIEYRKVGDSDWTVFKRKVEDAYAYTEYLNAYCGTGVTVWERQQAYKYCSTNSWAYWLWQLNPDIYSNSKYYTGRSRKIYTTKYYDTWTFSAAQTTPVKKEIRIDNLEPAQYEVRITRLTSVSTDPRLQNKSVWAGIGEIEYDTLSYPNIALAGFRIKATGQLSGDVNVSLDIERLPFGIFPELKAPDNPAWVFYDILTNPVYGYGISEDNIDMDAIREWAYWCDEPVSNGIDGCIERRAVFNGVFDFEGNLWDALVKVATVGRAAPIIKGTKYSVIVDKKAPMVQLFNMGNIKKDTLKLTYVGNEDLATEVEVQFTNNEKDYQNDTISVVVPEWFSTNNLQKKTTIQQMGITNVSQAYRAGRYYLACNKHIRRTVEFEAFIDAIDCEAGDIIGISHDVPMWGESGRLESATSDSVVLDKEVTLQQENSYTLTVRHLDNTFESFDIVFNDTVTTDTLSINGTFTKVPEKYDIYSLVEAPHSIKLFRIVSITRATDHTRKIKATEYNESIVTDATTILPSQNASEFTSRLPNITDFKISERLEKNSDGSIASYIDFVWSVDTDKFDDSICYDIFYKKGNDDSIDFWGNGYSIISNLTSREYTHLANDIDEQSVYTYKIIPRLKFSKAVPTATGRIATYTLVGKSEPPKEIENIQVSYSGGKYYLTWDKNMEVDFDYYEIRINGHVYTSLTNSLSIDNLDVGDYVIEAYAIDTTKHYSNPVYYNLHVAKPTTIYLIRDAYLIEKAFLDGVMTIYTSLTPPENPNKYDIWKVSVVNIQLNDFTYDDPILQNITWDVGVEYNLYKYWTGYDWILCSPEQIAAIQRMLGQLTTAGIEDNNVRVFNVQPYTPYDANDLWINGTDIYICNNSRTSGDFDANDWELAEKEDVTIASKIENIQGA